MPNDDVILQPARMIFIVTLFSRPLPGSRYIESRCSETIAFGNGGNRGRAHRGFRRGTTFMQDPTPKFRNDRYRSGGHDDTHDQTYEGDLPLGHPTCSTRRTRGALDRRPSQAQTAEVGRGGAGQQGGPRRLEDDGQWSMLLCEIGTHRVGACRIEISQTRRAIQLQPC
jgi:hypothetical protein